VTNKGGSPKGAGMASHEAELIDLIAEQGLIDKSTIRRDVPIEASGLDSVGMLSVLFAIEEKYGVDIANDEIDPSKTLGDLLDLLEARIAAKATPAA
jgi:acyl carrier protein